MCFSATASFVAGGALSGIGGVTVTQAKTRGELPFASIPLLFGIQQAIEGVVWVSFGSAFINTVATYAYAFFSHVLWPIFVPLAILLLEKNTARKKILRVFSVIGTGTALYLLYFISIDPLASSIVGDSLAYYSTQAYPPPIMAAYLLATCGSCLVASDKIIKIFGILLAISFAVSVLYFAATFISVWCFFAALLSVLIFWYFKISTHFPSRVDRNRA